KLSEKTITCATYGHGKQYAISPNMNFIAIYTKTCNNMYEPLPTRRLKSGVKPFAELYGFLCRVRSSLATISPSSKRMYGQKSAHTPITPCQNAPAGDWDVGTSVSEQ